MCVASLSRKYWHTRLRGLGGCAVVVLMRPSPIGRFREMEFDGIFKALERRAELDGRHVTSHRRDRARIVLKLLTKGVRIVDAQALIVRVDWRPPAGCLSASAVGGLAMGSGNPFWIIRHIALPQHIVFSPVRLIPQSAPYRSIRLYDFVRQEPLADNSSGD